jgi:hypothetical protein
MSRSSRLPYLAPLGAAVVAIGMGWGWCSSGNGGAAPWRISRPAAQPASPLPAGPDQSLVTSRCIICHSLETIAQQRQTREEWTAILDRMISYGMPVGPGDRERILVYLVRYLGQ